jgi:hypothetical protein
LILCEQWMVHSLRDLWHSPWLCKQITLGCSDLYHWAPSQRSQRHILLVNNDVQRYTPSLITLHGMFCLDALLLMTCCGLQVSWQAKSLKLSSLSLFCIWFWVSADSMTNNERLIGMLTWRDEGVIDGGIEACNHCRIILWWSYCLPCSPNQPLDAWNSVAINTNKHHTLAHRAYCNLHY